MYFKFLKKNTETIGNLSYLNTTSDFQDTQFARGNVSTEITFQVQSKAFDYLDAPIEKINTADTPAPYSPVLLAEWLPNSQDVIKAVKKVLYKK